MFQIQSLKLASLDCRDWRTFLPLIFLFASDFTQMNDGGTADMSYVGSQFYASS